VINLLKTKEATRARIIDGVKGIGSRSSKNDIVLFYYSGHGVKGPDNSKKSPDGLTKSFVAYDGQVDMSEVLRLLHSIKAFRVIVIIDA